MSKNYEQVIEAKVPRYEPQELNHDDYLNIEAEAAAARGAIKGFIGGSLMTMTYWAFRTSTSKSKLKPFIGGILGVAGVLATVDSFDEWESAANKVVRLVRLRIEERHKD